MESLAAIVTKSLQTSSGTEKILSGSSVEERREKLFFILTEYREACQYQALTVDEMEIRIGSWLPITAPIPADRLYDCYAWAMQNRQSQFPLSAVELVDAWKHLLNRAETEGSSSLRDDRLLTENAAGACVRCGKDGREIMLDGSIGGPCDHRRMTKEEEVEAARIKSEFLENARAESKLIQEARRKEEEEKAKEVKPETLQCSSCSRIANIKEGWREGDRCNAPLETNATCPKCGNKTGVLSMNKMVCRECFHRYDYLSCDGVLKTI